MDVAIPTATVTTENHSEIPAVVMAITAVDLRLCMDAKPEIGELVTIELDVPDSDTVAAVKGIVHWTDMRGKNHEVGLFTQQPLPGVLVDNFVDMRRRTERYRCRIHGQISWGEKSLDTAAVIANYSHSGISIRCDAPGLIDEPFSFRWMQRGTARTITGSALWQIEQDGGYLIGGQLAEGDGYLVAGLQ